MLPTTTAVLAGSGATAEGIANQMTKKQVNRALVSASQPRGVKPSSRNVMAQTAQQTLLAQEREKRRKIPDSEYTLVEF